MTPIDPTKFLHSLAAFMAGAAGSLPYASVASTSRAVWIFNAVEPAADPYSVLRPYGGAAAGWDLQRRASIQCMTIAKSAAAGMTRAMLLYETLFESAGYAWRMKQINGLTLAGVADAHYRLVSVDPLGPPGLIGVDDMGRSQSVFNFEVGFFKEAS